MHALKLPIVVFVLWIFAGPAFADTTLTLSPPAEKALNVAFDVPGAFSLNGGTYQNLELLVRFPRYVTVVKATYETATFPTFSCTTHPTTGITTCRFFNAFLNAGGGLSGSLTFNVILDRYRWRDGAAVDISGTLTSTGFTPPTGGTAPISVGPITGSITARPVWATTWHDYDRADGAGHVYFRAHPTTGEIGLIYKMDWRFRNDGSALIEAGATMTAVIPAGVTFVDAFPANNNDGMPSAGSALQVAHSLTPWVSVGGTVVGTQTTSVGAGAGQSWSNHLIIQAWIPCSAIPITVGTTSTSPYGARGTFDGVEINADLSTELHQMGPLTSWFGPDLTAATGGACGTGGSFTKGADTGQGEETFINWYLTLVPKKGVMPYTGVIIQDTLPSGLEVTSITSVTPPEFTTYSCTLPGVTAELTIPQLLGYVGTGECALGTRTNATHIMFYAPTWGSTATGILPFSATIRTYVPLGRIPLGVPEPYVITNNAVVNAVEPGSVAYRATATLNRSLFFKSRPYPVTVPNLTTTPAIVIAGAPAQVGFGLRRDGVYLRARNPSASITVPAGVTVTAVRSVFRTDQGCVPPTQWTDPVVGTNPLVFTYGSVATPYALNDHSNLGCVEQQIDFIPRRSHGFKNGDVITFTSASGATNKEPTYNPTATSSFTLTVPSEMRVGVEPGCYEGDNPRIVVTASNSGGVDLLNVKVRTAIPSPGDGVSTADATFAGLGPLPPGATIFYEVGGVMRSTLPGDLTTIDAVEMRFATIVVGADPKRLEILLTTNGGPGTQLYARAVMTEALLPPADSNFTQPVGVCPGTVDVTKFFDIDADGVKEPGEGNLSGWRFDVYDGDGVRIRTVSTDSSGHVQTLLNPDDYTFIEVIPTDSQGTWVATTTGGTSQTVTVIDHGAHVLTFGNDCNCPNDADGNPCTMLVCQPNGSCAAGGSPAGTTCTDGSACTTDACNGAGACIGTTIICQDTDQCTGDSCNPATGCVFAPLTGTPCALNACTVNAQCTGGICGGGTAVVCNDGVDCTTDSCSPSTGCTVVTVDANCADTNACTIDACTTSGCTHLAGPDGGACSDGNACTGTVQVPDACSAGDCVGGATLACDDGNTCTDDGCMAASGCVHQDNSAPCEDADACTVGGQCSGGDCVAGPALDCDDDNACTVDSCDALTGCVNAGGEDFDDGDPCTTDACAAGTITHTPNYVDADECTIDTCVANGDVPVVTHEDQTPIECRVPGGQVIWGGMWVQGQLKAFRCVVEAAGAAPTCETDAGGALVAYPPMCE